MKLGVLDQSHIAEGRTAADALNETTRLAQETDQLGYTRYWVSEHHAMKALSFSSPEVLIAHLAAHTKRIRVGSGGIMLPHYSAYKVAENFKLLEALHPGRIDLGLGRAPGGMPIATRALQEGKHVDIREYPQQVLELTGYLYQNLPEDHRFAGLLASPDISTTPQIWLLGSSDESARIAARLGAGYAFAQFFGVPGGEAATDYYLKHFQPSILNDTPKAMIAAMVVCAETEEEANRMAMSTDLFFLRLEKGLELEHLPSVQTALDFPYTEFDLDRVRSHRTRRIIGTPDQVKEKLIRMGELYQAEEILVVTAIHDFDARLRSYRLLAKAFNM